MKHTWALLAQMPQVICVQKYESKPERPVESFTEDLERMEDERFKTPFRF
jgi:hypothetical protein